MRYRPLDKTDKKIIKILENDARIHTTVLAEKVGLSQSGCWNRLVRLKRQRVIIGYKTIINPMAIENNGMMIIQIKMKKNSFHNSEQFENALSNFPEVMEVDAIVDDYDYLVKISGKNTSDLEKFIGGKLHQLDGIWKIKSAIVLRNIHTKYS